MHPALVSTLVLTIATLANLASGQPMGPGNATLILIVAFSAAALWHVLRIEPPVTDTPGAADAISSLSHELRTPLTTIIGLSELLAMTPEKNGQAAESAARIRRNGEILLGLIDDILAVGRLDSSPPVSGPIPVSHLVDECQRRFDRRVDTPNIALESQVDPDCPALVQADVALALASLRCLLDNSVKFAGSGTIHIHAKRGDDDRCWIRVHDEGPGISEASQDRLFEMFRQGDEGLGRQHEGAGVGLTLARRAAQSMGGDVIWIPTESGACFALILSTEKTTAGALPAAASTTP